jgi:23S rRNA (adenine2503-C2)-methyltransferase
MNLTLVKEFLDSRKEPAFRFRQIQKNYFSGRYANFSGMTDLSLDLRQQLQENFSLYSVKLEKLLKDDFTQKALLSLDDGQKIETVLMDYDQWLTACVSSQVGCPLGCKFCATGKMGFIRNLTAEEIVDQILFWNQSLYPKYVGRVVFMGMGEPFLNWDNLISALTIIKNDLNIGARKISLSTAGIIGGINKFADLNTEINLAVSLHSANQKTRESIMPVAGQYSLVDLKKSLDNYAAKTHRQIFFEYALIKDVNDTPQEINELSKFIKSNRLFFLNLISLNPIKNGLAPSTRLKAVETLLTKNHVDYSLRHSLGQSINSACGQLIVETPV